MRKTNNFIGWGVFYVPTREGRIFAGLEKELIEVFECEKEALRHASCLNEVGYIDDLHVGYEIQQTDYIPAGMQVKPKGVPQQ